MNNQSQNQSKIQLSELTAPVRGLVRIEWSRWKGEFVTEWIILVVLPALLLCCYLIGKLVFLRLGTAIYVLPESIYAFMGLPSQAADINFLFYMFFVIMILNLFVAGRKCRQAVQAVWWDERNGSIHVWINQLMSRTQIAVFKYVWLAVTFCLEYLVWHIILLSMVFAGSINAQQRQNGLEAMTRSFFMGALIILLLISAAWLYALKKPAADYAEYRLANNLVWGTLILGNLFKIRDVIVWLGAFFAENTSLTLPTEGIGEALDWLEVLRWLSPMSWLNPYAESGGILTVRILICIGLSGLFVFLGQMAYKKRNILC